MPFGYIPCVQLNPRNHPTMNSLLSVLLLSSLFLTGCIQTIAVRTVGGIVEDGFGAIAEEQDLTFAAQALPANLKLLEVMLRSDSNNERILLLLSEGYCSYALGFVEDTDPVRARLHYLRARDYGLRVLNKDRSFAAAFRGTPDELRTVLTRLDADRVPAVFWTAFAIGGYANITLADPNALADLPRAEVMMEFVASRDSSFYYGGADLFLGSLYGTRPRLFGGDTERATRHFERALVINRGRFLMTHVYYARSVAVQTLNETLFDDLLNTVDDASLEILPEFRLANAIAKQKAQMLRNRKSELF